MSFASQIFTYAGANLLNAAIPFFLLPILTAYLSPADYGLLSLLQLYATIALPFFMLNAHGLISVDYYRVGKYGIGELNGTTLSISAAVCVLVTLLVLPLGGRLAAELSAPAMWLMLVPSFCLLQVVPLLVSAIYQAQQRPRHYSYYKTGMTAANVALSIWFVVGLHEGWQGRMLAMFLANLLSSVIGLWLLDRNELFRLRFDARQAKALARFGLPLIPHAVAATLLAMSDRMMLARFVSLDETGRYTVAYQIASVLSLLFTSINQALAPSIFSELTEPSEGTRQRLVARSYKIMLAMLVLYVLFALTAPIAMKLVLNQRYHVSASLLALMGLGFLFQGFYFVVTNYIFFTKRTHFLSMLTGCSAVVSLGLNFILIPRLGSFGCGVTMAASWLLLFIGAWLMAHRVHPMPWFNSPTFQRN